MSEWADANRVLSSEASAEPGRWDTSRAEYQRGIMDACGDVLIPEVVVMKSAQVGWTEIVGNVTGYFMAQDPAPILVVQPTIDMSEAWSKDRLAPMIRDTPALRAVAGDGKSRQGGNTLRHKQFPGGHLTVAGANSAASLASRPIRVLLCDEVDRYPASAGNEGDPVDLARKRTTTFWNRRTLIGSTPTIAGASRIEAAYQASDRRRFWVPCPHCTEMQVLRWDQVRWTDEDASTAAYHCSSCGAAWTDVERWAAVRRGEWRAEAPFTGIAGFHISELYSPWRRIEETVRSFLDAKDSPDRLKVWKNTTLGETWQEAGEAPEWERLLERREGYPADLVPSAATVLTLGCDNQASPARLEVAVWAWGPGFEQWLIHTEQIDGSPGDDAPWDRVAKLMNRDWPHEGGGSLRIAMGAADTGGLHTAAVYGQLRRLREPRLLPVKGVPGWNKATPVSGPSFVDLTVGGRKLRKGLKLWTVSVDVFKAELYRRLWMTARDDGSLPSGWVHLPIWYGAEQVKQLVAEQLVTVKSRLGYSRREWRQIRPRNEQLDMAVYARAALAALGADRKGERFWTMARREEAAEAATLPAPAASPRPVEIAPPAVQQQDERPTAPAPATARKSRWGGF